MELRYNPTPDQTFELEGRGKYDFVRRKNQIDTLCREGNYTAACEARYEAFVDLAEVMPEDEVMPLRWEHANSRAALAIIHGSAIDHFRIGDLEMCMAQLELLLDSDPEDHFESISLLALCYIAMDEWSAYDDIVIDLSDKSPESVIARIWASVRRGGVDCALVSLLKSRHKAYYEELLLEEHPDDEQFRRDISQERPSQRAEAREWWLLTEPLWAEFPDLVDSIR